MTLEVFGYTAYGGINIALNDMLLTIPDDPANPLRAAVAAWEAEGNVIPPFPVATKEELLAYAGQVRWQVETGGITLPGDMRVETDDRSKTMIMGARMMADADPSYALRWKTPAGFVDLTAAEIVGISYAVLGHVDACFRAEGDIAAEIEAGTITKLIEIDAFDWPPN